MISGNPECVQKRLSVHLLTFCVCAITDTVQDVFIKLLTNINHHQMMCREQEPTLYLHFLGNYVPLNFFFDNSVRFITLIPSGIFS